MPTLFNQEKITLCLLPQAPRSVALATENFTHDLATVFSKDVVVVEKDAAEIVIGTLEQFTAANLTSKLDVTALYAESGALRWEAYLLQLVGKQLWIIGSDSRGTIYGLYELSRRLGVSPWHYFADVPVKKRSAYQVPADFCVTEYPAVKYRGIFINDEEELNNWAQAHTQDGTIGPVLYAKIFDLLLRLKANYIWPAMHVNYFNENPRNNQLANEMGIVVGTSHCDMLLRSNQNEWDPWLKSKGYTHDEVKYDYSLPGKNREILQAYWQESVAANREYEVSYTVGMRGIHDSGFVTRTIDNDTMLSTDEKFQAKKELLERVIHDQRDILAKTIGRPAADILQTFVPYKEVLPYYDQGLAIPEDVTIIWANDNYGYVRRYPSLQDQKRSGGHGLYYHSSYWAATNMHYLFISSTPLARMKNELQKAWDNGIQKLWVLNVGALKPIEQDLEFFTRFAFEIGQEKTTQNVENFLSQWLDDNFSGGIGAKVGPLLNQFTQITNVRKIEQLDPNTFSQVCFGDEGARRINALKVIFDEVNAVAETLPEAEQAAFFQLVQMKIHAAYYKNCEFYFADRSVLAHQQGKLQAAAAYTQRSATFTNFLRWMLHYYNKVMVDGKWDKILTPELAPPPNMKMYPTTKPPLQLGAPQLGYVLWQGANVTEEIILEQGSVAPRWLEVFNYGAGTVDYTLTASEGITLTKIKGTVATEERIFIGLTLAAQVGTGEIILGSGEKTQAIPVKIIAAKAQTAEREGAVVLPATSFIKKQDTAAAAFTVLPALGRGGGAALQASSPKLADLTATKSGRPFVEYEFFLTTAGSHLLEFYRFPSLNSVGQIRIEVQVDQAVTSVLASATTDEHRGQWANAVLDEVDKLYLRLPYLAAGQHTLRLTMLDSYVAFSKLVIYTQGFKKTSLGPVGNVKGNEAIPTVDNLLALAEKQYHSLASDVSGPEMLFADPSYYQQHFLAANLIRQPQKLGSMILTEEVPQNLDCLTALSKKQILERDEKIAFEAEMALTNTAVAYETPALPGAYPGAFDYLGTPTNQGQGLGLYLPGAAGLLWPDPEAAPSIHYRLTVQNPGKYYVWALLKYDDKGKDMLHVGINNTWLAPDAQFNHGRLFSYLNLSIWHWNCLAQVDLQAGENIFSIAGRSAGVKLDRFYLSKSTDLPPLDDAWTNTWS